MKLGVLIATTMYAGEVIAIGRACKGMRVEAGPVSNLALHVSNETVGVFDSDRAAQRAAACTNADHMQGLRALQAHAARQS